MLKILAALNALLVPTPHNPAISDVMGSPRTIADVTETEGASPAAYMLTQQKRWFVVAKAIAEENTAIALPDLRALLQDAPQSAMPMLRRAIRTRMAINLLQGLSLLSPAKGSSINGYDVCHDAPLKWRRQVYKPLSRLHDIRVTFQQQDCLKGLRSHTIS